MEKQFRAATLFKRAQAALIDGVRALEGTDQYGDDMDSALTAGEQANGSWFCSGYKARRDLGKWVAEGADGFTDTTLDRINELFCDGVHGPASLSGVLGEHVERGHCLLICVAVDVLWRHVLDESDYRDWSGQRELTPKMVREFVRIAKATTVGDFE